MRFRSTLHAALAVAVLLASPAAFADAELDAARFYRTESGITLVTPEMLGRHGPDVE